MACRPRGMAASRASAPTADAASAAPAPPRAAVGNAGESASPNAAPYRSAKRQARLVRAAAWPAGTPWSPGRSRRRIPPQLVDRRDAPVLVAKLDDLLRRDRPDAVDRVEVVHRCRPEADGPGRRTGVGRSGDRGAYARSRWRARRHDHLLPVGEPRCEVDCLDVRLCGRASGARDRIVYARRRRHAIHAGVHDLPRDVDHHVLAAGPDAEGATACVRARVLAASRATRGVADPIARAGCARTRGEHPARAHHEQAPRQPRRTRGAASG